MFLTKNKGGCDVMFVGSLLLLLQQAIETHEVSECGEREGNKCVCDVHATVGCDNCHDVSACSQLALGRAECGVRFLVLDA